MRTLEKSLVMIAGLSLVPPATAADPDGRRIAFVTSAFGSANFGSWPEADPETVGLTAADSICANLAEAAGLANAAGFVAFVSDSGDDAYCRINALSGKRDNNCGQQALPANAGPWLRTDGVPFGSTIERLLEPALEVYVPLNRDENGNVVPAAGRFAWTGSSGSGKVLGETCADWTAETSDTARVGVFDLSSEGWQFHGSRRCDQVAEEGHLMCLELGPGTPLDLPEPAGRLAFVTSVTGNAIFETWPDADAETSGLAAADSVCNNRAQAVGLPYAGSYKAWLSSSEVDARDRFEFGQAWYRPDGFMIAEGIEDLTSGQLRAAMNEEEIGYYAGTDAVWTGTAADGTADDSNCSDWQSSEGSGLTGRANTATGDWTSRGGLQCSASFGHLYCLSDVPPELLLEDGFEDNSP